MDSTDLQALSANNELTPWDRLFNSSGEAVLILDAVSENIVEANSAAATLLGMAPAALVASRIFEAFDTMSAKTLTLSLARARTWGRVRTKGVSSLRGAELWLEISFFQTNSGSYLVVHATAADTENDQSVDFTPSPAFDFLDAASVGFLVTDSSFRVEYANRGFLSLIKIASHHSVRGAPLGRWLAVSDALTASLGEQMWSRQTIEDFVTMLRPEQEAPRGVIVTVVAVPDANDPLWGFCVRELARFH